MGCLWHSYRFPLLSVFLALLFTTGQAVSQKQQRHRALLKPPRLKTSSARQTGHLKTSTRVDRLYFSSDTCIESRRIPIIELATTCPCFIQYTLQAEQTATWDVFVIPTSSYRRWRRIQFSGDPVDNVEEYSTRNKTVPAFGYLETPERNALINGEFTLAVRTNTDRRVCLSNDVPPGGSSIVFEAIPTPCPLKLPPNESNPRIVGGTEVTRGFGWMAVIWLVAIANPLQVCGGVHVSPGYIATAAHCLIQQAPSAYRVRVGTLRADQGELIRVRRAFTHPKYRTLNSKEAIYDITILELFSVPDTPVLQMNNDSREPMVGSWVSTAGFGYMSEDWSALPSPNLLRRVDVEVFGGECEESYDDVDVGIHICAGRQEGGCDSCLSDSGGPLVGWVNGSMRLMGIVSYGNGCARSGTPGVYTRISRMSGWVDATVDEARRTRQGPPVAALVGGLVGGVVAVLIIGVVVVVMMRRRPRPRPLVRSGSSIPSQTGVSE